ncbi:DUF3558 family protein [Saccharothrix australiensis]|uniref:Uncharacterized protein DUF3558 n=1 Tax=Saccharothrix australiensis TaxID=2072 RepID=A0A495VWC8_9PSEU|nr:DUF3558 family protein [Saccharothrix australiensis]RKT53027.1 uncharacterized protein DUF3558 [Saccharothrix australiensis]
MTSSRTWLVVAVTALTLSGCSYTINGDALPESGFTPPTTAASTTASGGGAPKIAKQRSVAGVDPCKLLSADDLKPVGALTREPSRKDDVIQESCQFVFDGASVVTALYQKYEHVRQRQPKGHETVVEGHSSWVSCDLDGTAMVCTTTTAVNPNRSILVAMTLNGGKSEQMLATMQPMIKAAMNRLPPA